jgi:hypothetical protein
LLAVLERAHQSKSVIGLPAILVQLLAHGSPQGIGITPGFGLELDNFQTTADGVKIDQRLVTDLLWWWWLATNSSDQ